MSRLNVVLLGSGAREHALHDAIRKSPKLESLYVLPGNAAMETCSVDIQVEDHAGIATFCKENDIDLVVIGPEPPLVAGVVDYLTREGILCFGPSAAAAQLEGSKSFARDFADRYDIPGPVTGRFTESADAIAWFHDFGRPVVVKADGLAAGKGVVIPETVTETEDAIREMLDEGSMGEAGRTILLEERLEGEEFSLFGIADGSGVAMLSTAQDHKRVGEGDTGLNTGGMGAFAPVPGLSHMEAELIEKFLVPVVTGMASEGTPYVGIIFAGVMLTEEGSKLIEYNCRFGDPEAQAILPLLGCDALDLFYSAAVGNLSEVSVNMVADRSCAAVVLAADGYPEDPTKGLVIPELAATDSFSPYYAGVALDGDSFVNTGGRVLTISAIGDDLDSALDASYRVVNTIVGDGLFARSDIGWRHLSADSGNSEYVEQANEGQIDDAQDVESQSVSVIDAEPASNVENVEVVEEKNEDVAQEIPQVDIPTAISIGDVVAGKNSPFLTSAIASSGTKALFVEEMNQWEILGEDIVNSASNEILAQGGLPSYFVGSFLSSWEDPGVASRVLAGASSACLDNDCSLLDLSFSTQNSGSVDVGIVGSVVGVLEQDRALSLRSDIKPGYVLVGLPSSGLHTQGYDVIRKSVMGENLQKVVLETGDVLSDVLLKPHRSYVPSLQSAVTEGLVAGLIHVADGGLAGSLSQYLIEKEYGFSIDSSSWNVPQIFRYLSSTVGLTEQESFEVFNQGIGMVALVDPECLEDAQSAIGEVSKVIGEVVVEGGVFIS